MIGSICHDNVNPVFLASVINDISEMEREGRNMIHSHWHHPEDLKAALCNIKPLKSTGNTQKLFPYLLCPHPGIFPLFMSTKTFYYWPASFSSYFSSAAGSASAMTQWCHLWVWFEADDLKWPGSSPWPGKKVHVWFQRPKSWIQTNSVELKISLELMGHISHDLWAAAIIRN